jgi:hypothetical protein
MNRLDVCWALEKNYSVGVKLIVKPVSDFSADIDYKKALRLAQTCSCNIPVFVKIEDYCGQILPTPYLEIEPELIWVYAGWEIENYVFSNTNWKIN